MPQRDVVLCAPVRTAIGTFGGTLREIPATELGAVVIRECLRRAGLAGEAVDSVVMGQVIQAGARMNPARQAAIQGGLSVQVPAMTVNRVCGSGAQAIVNVAQEIWLGQADCGLGGGMENMDQAPYLVANGRWGYRLGDSKLIDSMLHDGLNDAFSGEHAGWHTEDLIKAQEVSREAQDAWALRSQQRFAAAQSAGKFQAEIVPVTIEGRKKTMSFAVDEHNHPDTTAESLTRLKPVFRKDGAITAGNAPGLNSGGAAVVVAGGDWAKQQGLQPVARLVAYGIGALEPGMFGMAPVRAVRQALARAGWSLGDLDRAEVNEAFAAIAVAVTRELGLSEDIVNVDGGAIAHGHPIGATGAILAVKLLHAMERGECRRGLVSLCIGGGQGIALLLEAL